MHTLWPPPRALQTALTTLQATSPGNGLPIGKSAEPASQEARACMGLKSKSCQAVRVYLVRGFPPSCPSALPGGDL